MGTFLVSDQLSVPGAYCASSGDFWIGVTLSFMILFDMSSSMTFVFDRAYVRIYGPCVRRMRLFDSFEQALRLGQTRMWHVRGGRCLPHFQNVSVALNDPYCRNRSYIFSGWLPFVFLASFMSSTRSTSLW